MEIAALITIIFSYVHETVIEYFELPCITCFIAVLDVNFVYFSRENGNTDGNFSIVPYMCEKVIAY